MGPVPCILLVMLYRLGIRVSHFWGIRVHRITERLPAKSIDGLIILITVVSDLRPLIYQTKIMKSIISIVILATAFVCVLAHALRGGSKGKSDLKTK